MMNKYLSSSENSFSRVGVSNIFLSVTTTSVDTKSDGMFW